MNNFNNPWSNFSSSNNSMNNNAKVTDFNFYKNNFNITKIVVVALCVIFFGWLSTGIYKIDAHEEAIVLYFGKFYQVQEPGLNFAVPSPIGKVIKVATKTINKEEFGFRTDKKEVVNISWESLMLTGDENIVDIDFEVQWKVKDIKKYAFVLVDPSLTIRTTSESVMREIIATRPINDVLANKKLEIELQAKDMIQKILDDYDSGVEIVLVQLLRVDPPEKVIDSFRDVQTAKADKERKINEAETYRNDLLPKTRGEAERIVKQAEAYKETLISQTTGEIERFLKVYNSYKSNKELNKKRIYLETMRDVMKNTNKTIINEDISNKILQHREIKGN